MDILKRWLPTFAVRMSVATQRAKRRLFPYFGAGAVVARRLNRSTKGLLVILIAAYTWLYLFGSRRPATPAQLILWFDDLPYEMKGALLAALLTIMGFVIAFGTAQAAWRKQRYTEMLLRAADEIGDYFDPILRESNTVAFHARDLLKARRAIASGPITEQDMFLLNWIVINAPKAKLAVENIWRASIEVHSLSSRHANALINRNATGLMEMAVRGLGELAELGFGVYQYQNADHAWHVLASADDDEKWQSYFDYREDYGTRISFAAGAVRGRLQAVILDPSIHYLRWILRETKHVPGHLIDVAIRGGDDGKR